MRNNGQARLTAGLIAAGAGLVIAGSAAAAPAPAAGADEPATLDAVIVTARKRAENIQDVPASVVAVGQTQIQALKADNLADLARVSPGFSVADSGQITLRGVTSSTRNVGFEAGAAVYIDGVYQGRPVGNNQDLLDVEQVEVLRGPQGTLYGKNNSFGAVGITTARPGDTFRGLAQIDISQDGGRRFAGYVSGPIVADRAGFKLSAYSAQRDGYQRNLFDGSTYGDIDRSGVRGELRFTPEGWDFSLRADWAQDTGRPVFPEVVVGAPPFAPVTAGIDTVKYDTPYQRRVRGGGVSLTAEHTFDNGLTLTSITGWRKLDYRVRSEADFSSVNLLSSIVDDTGRHFTQEVRLASPTGGRLSYMIGGYYFNQTLETDRSGRPGPLLGGGFFQDLGDVRTRAYAVFGSLDYQLTDSLSANFGLRYTSERKTLDFTQFNSTLHPLLNASVYPNFTLKDKLTDSDLSPTVTLMYRFTPDVSAYARYSVGFKSGGWNVDVTQSTRPIFGAETVKNYELGLRTQLLERRLTLNVTVFHMVLDNLQVSQKLAAIAPPVVTNAGGAKVDGVELEARARLASWLTLTGGAAYNRSRYTDFRFSPTKNFAGQSFTNSPTWSGFAAFDARWPVGDVGDLLVQGDVASRGDVWFENDRVLNPFRGGASTISNLRVGLEFNNGVTVLAFGENLSDERPEVSHRKDDFLGTTIVSYGPPRQYGVRLSVKF